MEPLPIRFVYKSDEVERLNEELLNQSPMSFDTEGYSALDAEEEADDEGEGREEQNCTPVNNGLAFSLQFSYRVQNGVGPLERIVVLNWGDLYGNNVYTLAPTLTAKHPLIMHNAPHDVHTLWNHGVVIPEDGPVWDTMGMVFGLDQNRKYLPKGIGGYGLKACTKFYLGRKRHKFKDVFGSVKLRRDGQPYADRRVEIEPLEDYLELKQYPPPASALEVEANGRAEMEAWWKDKENDIHWDMSYWGKWWNFLVYASNDTWDTYELYEDRLAKFLELPWGQGTYWDYWEHFEFPILREVTIEMERHGMLLDRKFLRLQRQRCERDLEQLEEEVIKWAGCPIEIGKDRQLAMLLHGEGMQPIFSGASKYKATTSKSKVVFYIPGRKIPVIDRTDGGEPSMGAPALVKLAEWAEDHGRTDLDGLQYIVRHSKADKQRGTYLKGMDFLSQDWQPTLEERLWMNELGFSNEYLDSLDYGVLHTVLKQFGPSSGRYASKAPNLQNITTGAKDLYYLRDSFVAPPGYVLVVIDFSNLEYRLLAHFSNDKLLIEAFNNGYDMHSLTAYNVWPEVKIATDKQFGSCTIEAQKWIKNEFSDLRDKKAKVLNFEIIYGVGPKKLGEQLKLGFNKVTKSFDLNKQKEEAKKMIKGWYSTYPAVEVWQKNTLAACRVNGYIKTLMGRYRFADMKRLNSEEYGPRGEEERTLLNAGIQGSAADITKKAQLRIARDPRLKELGYKQIMQVHDEIIGICPIFCIGDVKEQLEVDCHEPFGRPLRVSFPVSIGYGHTHAEAKH